MPSNQNTSGKVRLIYSALKNYLKVLPFQLHSKRLPITVLWRGWNFFWLQTGVCLLQIMWEINSFWSSYKKNSETRKPVYIHVDLATTNCWFLLTLSWQMKGLITFSQTRSKGYQNMDSCLREAHVGYPNLKNFQTKNSAHIRKTPSSPQPFQMHNPTFKANLQHETPF